MCEKLYDLDKDVRIVPQLAESLPKTSSDGKTVTIALRDGVKFADGTPLNAEAVKASLERNLTNPQSARVSELGPIESVEATDATHRHHQAEDARSHRSPLCWPTGPAW